MARQLGTLSRIWWHDGLGAIRPPPDEPLSGWRPPAGPEAIPLTEERAKRIIAMMRGRMVESAHDPVKREPMVRSLGLIDEDE